MCRVGCYCAGPFHAGGLLLHQRPVRRYFTRVTVRVKDITTRGHFEEERVGTPFPLLKCLRTHKTHLKLRKKNKNALRLLPYAKPRVVVQSTLTKIIKIVANRWRILWLKCTKIDFGWGSAPHPAGELTAPPDPLAGFGAYF